MAVIRQSHEIAQFLGDFAIQLIRMSFSPEAVIACPPIVAFRLIFAGFFTTP
jgi:hypothetical protein